MATAHLRETRSGHVAVTTDGWISAAHFERYRTTIRQFARWRQTDRCWIANLVTPAALTALTTALRSLGIFEQVHNHITQPTPVAIPAPISVPAPIPAVPAPVVSRFEQTLALAAELARVTAAMATDSAATLRERRDALVAQLGLA